MARKRAPRLPARTDPHRPGAIVPGDYEYLLSYNTACTMDGWPIPPHGIDCAMDRRRTDADGRARNGCCPEHDPDHGPVRCCALNIRRVHGLAPTRREHGIGKCTVCGAHFNYGDVWLHVPTGKAIHVGHECAHKYELMADRSAWEREHGRARAATAKAIERDQRERACAAFLEDHPGLADDLEVDHPIVADIASRFRRFGDMSERQIALVRKLADEVRNPPLPETHVPAPSGRVTFEGEIVSAKVHDTAYGDAVKITIKVATNAGTWLAWGTCPAAILSDRLRDARDLRGARVEIRATLKRGREPHFSLMTRPSGRVVSWHEPPQNRGAS